MRKHLAFIIGLSLAVAGSGFALQAQGGVLDPTPDDSGPGKIVEAKTVDGKPAIVFVSPSGKNLGQIIIPPENWGREKTRATYVVNPTRTFVAFNQMSIRHYRNRPHQEEQIVNMLTYRDAQGRVLFEKQNVKYQAVAVSGNGEAVVCLAQADKAFEGRRRWQVGKTSIVVLSGRGQDIFRVEEDGVDEQQIRISANGRWLAYKYFKNAKVSNAGYKVADIARKSLRELAGAPAGGLGAILDDGSVEDLKHR